MASFILINEKFDIVEASKVGFLYLLENNFRWFMEGLLRNNAMAEVLGMTPSAFAKGVRSGRFSIAMRDDNGIPLYDPVVVGQEYEETKTAAEIQNRARFMPKERQGGRPSGTDNGGKSRTEDPFMRAKLMDAGYSAKLKELDFKFRSGELIEKVLVEKQGAELGEIMKGAIESWPARLAPELAGMQGKDEHDFRLKLEIECNKLIIDIMSRCGVPVENG